MDCYVLKKTNRMKRKSLLLLVFGVLFLSCKDSSKSNSSEDISKEAKTEKKSKEEGKIYRLPPLPSHIYQDLYKNSDYLDVLFEDLDFSMSQDNNASIRSFLQNISLKRSAVLNTACEPMGHASFQKNGQSIIEADFYHEPDCYYFIFYYENEQPMFSNSMSETGIRFFKRLKSQSFKPEK